MERNQLTCKRPKEERQEGIINLNDEYILVNYRQHASELTFHVQQPTITCQHLCQAY